MFTLCMSLISRYTCLFAQRIFLNFVEFYSPQNNLFFLKTCRNQLRIRKKLAFLF